MATDPFTRVVVQEMQNLYPEVLADRAWDNVGLLLENSTLASTTSSRERVLLTNDLTPDVADEAIAYKASVIVAYHPIIFRGLKSLTLKDTQQASLIKLMQNNIAVYSPHTALDAGVDGINDWLADTVKDAGQLLGATNASVTVIKSVRDRLPSSSQYAVDGEGEPLDVGYGRRIAFTQRLPVADLIKDFLRGMGLDMSHVLVARPRASSAMPWPKDEVSSVGVCAGSGFDIFRENLKDFDMLITGEVSHHDALYATTRGVWVVCLLHSNSERKFLSSRLQGQLTRRITGHSNFKNATVLVSEKDRDPFEFWDVNNPAEPNNSRPEAYTV